MSGRGFVHATRPFARCSLAVGVAVGHHHNHGFRFARRDEVVHNLRGAPQRGPRVFIAARAVQQVEHRIASASLLVAGGRVHGHAAVHLQRGAVVPDFRDIAVRHVVHAVQVARVARGLFHDENVRVRGDVAAHVDVGRVEHRHSVHPERVIVKLRLERLRGVGPHPVLFFLQLGHTRRLHLAHGRGDFGLRQEIARHLHFDGLRGKEAEGHRAVVIHLGRNKVAAAKQGLLREGAEGKDRASQQGNHSSEHSCYFSKTNLAKMARKHPQK